MLILIIKFVDALEKISCITSRYKMPSISNFLFSYKFFTNKRLLILKLYDIPFIDNIRIMYDIFRLSGYSSSFYLKFKLPASHNAMLTCYMNNSPLHIGQKYLTSSIYVLFLLISSAKYICSISFYLNVFSTQAILYSTAILDFKTNT